MIRWLSNVSLVVRFRDNFRFLTWGCLTTQKAHSFFWVFQVGLPLLIGKALKETKFLVSDGDNQECQQIDDTIESLTDQRRMG